MDDPRVEITFQGNLVEFTVQGIPKPLPAPSKKSTRGLIVDYSRKSRIRLIKKTARLYADKAVFLTLTYGRYFPSPKGAKRHLQILMKRLKRRFPLASGFWRMEPQKRGAPHFHLLLFNVPFIHWKKIQAVWGEIIGQESPRIKIELVKSKRAIMRYVSKYVAKYDAGGSCFLVNSPYLTVGRVWGVWNEQHIPYAVSVEITVIGRFCDDKRYSIHDFYHTMRRYAARKCRRIRRDMEYLSFFLLTDDTSAWLDLTNRTFIDTVYSQE